MPSFIQDVKTAGVVAIIRLDDLTDAVPLAQALIAGGVTALEFTLTNPDAPQAIAAVREKAGEEAYIGAGSVIYPNQVDEVADAGGQFIVCPTTNPTVIERCHYHTIPVIPGAYTPTEIQTAWEMNAAAVKVFPARQLGAKYIKDVLAPLPHLRLIPTGGIGQNNIAEYMQAGAWAVGVGSSLVNPKAIAAKDWSQVTKDAEALMGAIK